MEMELKVAIFFANRIFHLAQFQSPLLNPPPNHPKHLRILSRKEKVSVDYNESQRKISSPLPVSSRFRPLSGGRETKLWTKGNVRQFLPSSPPHPLFHVSINANLLEQCAIWFPRVVSPRLVPSSLVHRHERHRRTNGSCGMATTSSSSRHGNHVRNSVERLIREIGRQKWWKGK